LRAGSLSSPSVTRLLRERFVAAWEKKGTLTVVKRRGRVTKQGGNVVGYVCTSSGEVIHAIPEVPSAQRYVEELEWALSLADALKRIPQRERAGRVARAHRRSQRGGAALRADVHTYFAAKPFPRIRDVEQELFSRLLNEQWSPSKPINTIGGTLCR
jgi:hypothetical protein